MTTENLPTTIDYSDPKMIATLKATVAQGATNEEFAMFAELCKSTGLNPFKREVWFIKGKSYTNKNGQHVEGRVQMMTGLNGFLAIANRHPAYDGMECEVERDKNGQPVRAVAKVWRKDRKFPSIGEALWSEYYRPNPYGNKGVWEQMGSVMLAKCAKSLALREGFPQEMNGLYTEEEMPREYAATIIAPKQETIVAPQPAIAADPVRYTIPDITREQELYLEKRGAHKDADGAWIAPTDLGPKLAKYREMVGKPKEASVRAESSNAWMEPTEDQLEAAFQAAKEE